MPEVGGIALFAILIRVDLVKQELFQEKTRNVCTVAQSRDTDWCGSFSKEEQIYSKDNP